VKPYKLTMSQSLKSDTVSIRVSRSNYEKIARAGNASDSLNDALTRLLDCNCKHEDNEKE
jgi:hypothetical protein